MVTAAGEVVHLDLGIGQGLADGGLDLIRVNHRGERRAGGI
jgi:hypothetical protein